MRDFTRPCRFTLAMIFAMAFCAYAQAANLKVNCNSTGALSTINGALKLLDPQTAVIPHLFSKLGLFHELGDRFREFRFAVWFNVKSSLAGGKPRFFQVEGNNGLRIRHVLHDFDPGRDVVQRAGRIGIHANIGRG